MKIKSNAMKSSKVKAFTSAAVTGAFVFLIQAHAFAEDAKGALSKAGIDAKTIDGKGTDTLYGSLTKLIYIIMGLGGLWSVLWIIIGAMTLSGSNGNPQKRALGIGALVTAAGGLFVIYKAWDIAGWAVSLGS
ncbi:hypothetical protein PVA17_20195 [Lysinibacillus sp. CNPSo 3705]|uniref:hypothetical protein n=1 Tax=Lysinibacillus sp. CNPSo 3705 TaxID=3028148 RepID=UPI002363F165|nr:hypothetical protein [Lysinibacillus sp. CNPSo 3705]MDD1505066.1 hypothetical protein [Lysinibacillus sp. CNPSo 3705]